MREQKVRIKEDLPSFIMRQEATMFFLALTLIKGIEASQTSDLIDFTKAAVDFWKPKEITLLDTTNDDDSDLAMDNLTLFLRQPTPMRKRYLSTSSMNVTSKDMDSNLLQSAVVTNSKDAQFVEDITANLLEKKSWFVPSDLTFSLTNVKLRLDSNVYLYSRYGETTFNLDEMFAVKQGSQIKQRIGQWNQDKGWKVKETNVWERRRNFNGAILVNALLTATPASPVSNAITTAMGVKAKGYMPELLQELSETLNFKLKHVVPPDGAQTGPTGMLSRKEADTSTVGMTASYANGHLTTDATIPILNELTTLIVKKPSGAGTVNIWAYVKTFAFVAWIVFFISMLALVAGLIAIGKSGIETYSSYNSNYLDFMDAVGILFVTILQRDQHVMRQRNSTHMMMLVICTHCFLMFTYFNAVLTSYMTVLDPPMVVYTFYDVLPNDYQMITVKGSPEEKFLLKVKQPSVFYDIYSQSMLDRPSEAFVDSLDAAKKAVMNSDKLGLFAPSLAAYGIPELIALKLPEALKDYYGIGLQANSEFKRSFNHFLLKMRQGGVVKKIYDKWFNETSAMNKIDDQLSNETLVLSFGHLIFPFLILFGGIGCSVFGIVFELLVKKCGKNNWMDRIGKESEKKSTLGAFF